MSVRRVPRVILHLDMDAFYAAIEVREAPELADKPVIVGHRGRRGVVSTCSYVARRFGVRSAMPSVTAARLCPEAFWLPGRMSLYVAVSREIRKILRDFSPLVEPLSIDEAFIDLTGIASSLRAGARTARELKERIRREQRLTASVGVAANKFLAKLASDLDKPDGLTVLPHHALETKLWPLPIERLWGVGPSTARRLRAASVERIGDLLRIPPERLDRVLGTAAASHLRALARGDDARPVVPSRAAKSISEERTYAEDLTDPADVGRALLARADAVARQLRRDGLAARTVHLKVRAGDFTTWTRAHTLPFPTDLAEPIVEACRGMLCDRVPLGGRGIRLLGVSVSGLADADRAPRALFEDAEERRARRMSRAADMVRDRLGDGALTRARLLRRPRRADDDGTAAAEASSLPTVD